MPFSLSRTKTTDLIEVLADLRPIPGSCEVPGLLFSFVHTKLMWTVSAEHGPVAIWGIVEPKGLLDPAGVWMVTTRQAPRYKIALLRLGRRFFAEALERYGGLYGYAVADAPHEWLTKFGFTVDPLEHGYRRFSQWLPPSPSLQ